ncbi:MAG: cytochrome c biogenesis protein ResB [Proteobacteria bacterium]|nr:cytochrome c biogenesis protein ResB [Pseudomonadota bacterium]
MAASKPLTHRLVDFLASVKLALFTLIALAVAAVGGTVIPQNLDPAQYIHGYGPRLYTFLAYLDMFDMYHAWWFNVLLALLVANLVVCSMKRLPQTFKLTRPVHPDRIQVDFLLKQSYSHSFKRPGRPDDLAPGARDAFRTGFSRPREIETAWGRLLWADRGAFSRFGAYLVHFSLFFIIAGAMVGGASGYEAFLNLEEGRTADQVVGRRPAGMIRLPFSLRLDRFVVKFYDNGMPSEYRSEVTVIEDGRDVHKADILVNHPLTWRGVTFYQNSYGQSPGGRVGLRLARLSDGRSFDLDLRPDIPGELPEHGGTIQVLEVVPDVMKAGPAARILVRPAQGPAYTDWAFEKRPPMAKPGPHPWRIDLTGNQPRYYTGLQVNRDPGVWLVWVGCGLMIVGFFITFFFAHQKLYLGLVAEKNRTRFILAGSTHRNPGSFALKFERLAEAIAGPAFGDQDE